MVFRGPRSWAIMGDMSWLSFELLSLITRPLRAIYTALTQRPSVESARVDVIRLRWCPTVRPKYPKEGETQENGVKVIVDAYIVLVNHGPVGTKIAEMYFLVKARRGGFSAELTTLVDRVKEARIAGRGDWRASAEFQGFMTGVSELPSRIEGWLVVKPAAQSPHKKKVRLPRAFRIPGD